MNGIAITAWLMAAVCFAASLHNLYGSAAVKESFIRYGYPAGWHRVTGILEFGGAVLIILPATRFAGAVLLATVLSAAAGTVAWHRDWKPLAPCLVLASGAIFVAVHGLGGFRLWAVQM